MGLKTHAKVRLALLVVGFFGGAVLHMLYFSHLRGLGTLLFFAMPIAGVFLLPLAFTKLYPAACPRCGGVALPQTQNPALYVCRECHAESNVLEALVREAIEPEQKVLAPGEVPAAPKRSMVGRMMWFFLAAGLLALAVGGFKASDSIQLLREGVSTDAKVAKITTSYGRDSEGHATTIQTAHVEYRAGSTSHVLQRSWSYQSSGGSCMWPCYKQGEALKVIYLPSEPGTAQIHSLGELFFGSAMFGFVGLVFVVIAVIVLRKSG